MSRVTSHHPYNAAVWQNHSGGIVYEPDLLRKHQLEPGHWLFDPGFWSARQSVSTLAGGRGRVYFINDNDCRWVLRHYRRGGLIGKLIADRYLWLGAAATRSFREWQLLAQLQAQGLPVPAPVAARYQRSGLSYQADLITVAIPQARTLAQVLEAGSLATSVWQQLGAVLARFHAAGVHHADLNAHNIVFDAAQSIYLLDFDRGRIRAVQPAWIAAVLQRLLRSLNKLDSERTLHFTLNDWQHLLQAHATKLTQLRE
jgi:3-deoxy-D-manno-octulosonic acid kinase